MTSTKTILANQLKAFTPFRFFYANYFKIPVKIYNCKLNKAMICFEFLNGSVMRVNSTKKIEIHEQSNTN